MLEKVFLQNNHPDTEFVNKKIKKKLIFKKKKKEKRIGNKNG